MAEPILIVGYNQRTEQGGFKVEIVFADGNRMPLPHIERHSPSGFAWGYGGSGPSDLALSLVAFVTGLGEQAKNIPALYQEFKRDVVALLPPEGFTLPVVLVRSWAMTHGLLEYGEEADL